MNDSHDYRFPYLIRSGEDFPEDFSSAVPHLIDRTLFPALFLPLDDADWFGRWTNPSRVVLMTDETLEIHFHPKSRKTAVSLLLDDYVSIQSGRLFLIGWIGFASKTADTRLPYNRRNVTPVRGFLGMLRARALRPDGALSSKSVVLGDALDLRFQNVLNREMDKGEIERARLFSAPRKRSGNWLFRMNPWTTGNLITLTDRRLLWITERYRREHELYESVTCYANVRNIARVDVSSDDPALRLSISLQNGKTWKLDIPAELAADANEFAAMAGSAATPTDRVTVNARSIRPFD